MVSGPSNDDHSEYKQNESTSSDKYVSLDDRAMVSIRHDNDEMRERPDIDKFRDLMDVAEGRRGKASPHVTQTAISQLRRYYRFLHVILARYKEESAQYADAIRRMNELEQFNDSLGRTELTPEEIEVYELVETLTDQLHLEIESFYLLAKILLDKIARFIEHYFGAQVRKRPLDSHDDLVKNLEAYCASKSLTVPERMIAAAVNLKTRVSDLRDYQISHEKTPRTMHGTQLLSENRIKLVLIRMNPKRKRGRFD